MDLTQISHPDAMTILGEAIPLGTSRRMDLGIASLFTDTPVEVPIIIERSAIPGPTVLITAGIHGDEVNGVEVVRQIISHGVNKPAKGSIICIPVVNVFGFIGRSRYFPDGRDLNRAFPGLKNGSLASRVAHRFTTEVLPAADFCMDFHTGGAERNNAAQVRIAADDAQLKAIADVFQAPFTLIEPQIEGSYRSTCQKMGIPILLNESGMSLRLDKEMAREAVDGAIRVLHHLGMLAPGIRVPVPSHKNVLVADNKWVRAERSGFLHVKVAMHQYVEAGEVLCTISDPYGSKSDPMTAARAGYVINISRAPMVYQGDAIFNMAVQVEA
ncbi:MAG: succinylglutamate desuccinylase/aspartoacylase family protein [Flavobacteriales bacterium]|jgi:predicted deacylase|nr:succinylglutamate desuccinylase/aspartoacylase family protein [Flavobacteriales bacterium]MCI1751450.1 succinylglutamate desuccinylase/aspartoacylase family protein [Flavobacteriales bacterium]